jgi:hypothetical protein
MLVGASVDTKDYENDNPDTNWVSFEKFKREVDAGGTIVLAHDAHQHTVEILVDNMLDDVEKRGLSGMLFFFSFLFFVFVGGYVIWLIDFPYSCYCWRVSW